MNASNVLGQCVDHRAAKVDVSPQVTAPLQNHSSITIYTHHLAPFSLSLYSYIFVFFSFL